MSKIRKLMVVCVMALMMMVVLSAPAMAQSYGPYWNPGWLGPPATTEPEPDWQCGWVWSPEEDDWVWACWLD